MSTNRYANECENACALIDVAGETWNVFSIESMNDCGSTYNATRTNIRDEYDLSALGMYSHHHCDFLAPNRMQLTLQVRSGYQ